MADVIKVEFDGKSRRFPYPDQTVENFLVKLRAEYHISADVDLQLLEGDEELTKSSTLRELGVQPAAKLILKRMDSDNDLIVRVQTVCGQMYRFTLLKEATVKDLYDAIHREKKFTATFPLLFNHRMHLFQTPKFLEESLISLLELTPISSERIPHFYLFECDRKFETHAHDYAKSLKEIFIIHDVWQPRSAAQTSEALQIFLNTMFALVRVFLTEKEADTDSVHHVYMAQFLIVLRRYLFPPACLAFKHALEGALFDYEKLTLSEGLFYLFRSLLPASIPDNALFEYAPYIFCWIFQHADHTSIENACYENAELINRRTIQNASIPMMSDTATNEYFIKPVRLLNDKLERSTSERFVLMEYDEIQAKSEISTTDYQVQTDLVGLLLLMKDMGNKTTIPGASLTKKIFEIFSTDYTLWSPGSNADLASIGDVNEQRRLLSSFKEDEMKQLKHQLATNDLYSIFTFADPSKLSKHNHAQMILLQSGNIVYIKDAAKNSEDTFICFDPSAEKEEFQKSEVASKDAHDSRAHVVVRENVADIRKIEQITCILFDISGSMHAVVGDANNQHTLLELSTMAFGAWRDRLISYKLPHALGLIYFGANDEPTMDSSAAVNRFPPWARRGPRPSNDRIVLQCDITREFIRFEKALANRPECGFDTPLYDAIDRGIETIRSFRAKEKTRLSPTCKQLILCLTDGVDNCSKVSRSTILEQLLQEQIVFDAISFDKAPDSALIDFCEKTKGYYYVDVRHDNGSMLSLFELEAAISIQDREQDVYGRIERPQRRRPELLDKPAIASKQARFGDGRASSISLRRVMQEIHHLNNSRLSNFELFVSKEHIFFWKIIMHGETGTPYADGRWLLSVEFPLNYPEKPPEIRFITKIYHCNINDDGKICHDILTTAWSQKTPIHNVLMEILRLLREPNADDALSSVKGTQYKESRDDYMNTVIEWRLKYANASVEELKQTYALE